MGHVFFNGGGQFGNEEVQEDGELLPFGNVVGQDGRQEAVGSEECLCISLELDLSGFVELF